MREEGEGGREGRGEGQGEGWRGGEWRERGARAKLGFPPSNVFNDNVQSIR